MFRTLKRILSRAPAAPSAPAVRTLGDLNRGFCPSCSHDKFYRGPQGGSALNVKCAKCGTCYWYGPPFTPTEIPDTGMYNTRREPAKLEDI